MIEKKRKKRFVTFLQKEKNNAKVFSLTIAVLIALGLVFLSSPALAVPDFPVGPPVDVGGQVPVVAAWTLTPLGNYAPFFTGVDAAVLDAGYIAIPDLSVITAFRCNTKFKITAGRGNWTLPADYPAEGEKFDQADGDLLLMVDNVTPGYDPPGEGMAALDGFNNPEVFTPILAAAASDIIEGGNIHSVDNPGTHGVRDAACDINARILMDWANDVPGAYAISITLTIAQP